MNKTNSEAKYKVTKTGDKFYLWRVTSFGDRLVTIDKSKQNIYTYASYLLKGN